ncbi:hypothetical protein BD749_0583 [Pontibacter ramchanderi]|uniref:Uncharacterized protein n=1 Tax=Pontibacter ramchanderi TaxID=1179743 RepID=A0A2N3V1Y8_9BACT|nr:hypothetical protein BD749_0583 [Pontibacter ramchanderi]
MNCHVQSLVQCYGYNCYEKQCYFKLTLYQNLDKCFLTFWHNFFGYLNTIKDALYVFIS